MQQFRGTTILSVRKGNQVVVGGGLVDVVLVVAATLRDGFAIEAEFFATVEAEAAAFQGQRIPQRWTNNSECLFTDSTTCHLSCQLGSVKRRTKGATRGETLYKLRKVLWSYLVETFENEYEMSELDSKGTWQPVKFR